MKKPHVVYATRFPGELPAINRFLALYGVTAQLRENFLRHPTPEFQIRGTRLGPNAWSMSHSLAAELIHEEALRLESFLIIAEVTAAFIPSLHNEPGMYLRCWRDHAEHASPPKCMEDEENLLYFLERTRHLRGPDRKAVLKTALSAVIIVPAESTSNGRASVAHPAEGVLKGMIREEPSELRVDGVPLAPIFVTEYGWLLGELCAMEMDFKDKHNLFDHREKALKELMNDQGIKNFLNPERTFE